MIDIGFAKRAPRRRDQHVPLDRGAPRPARPAGNALASTFASRRDVGWAWAGVEAGRRRRAQHRRAPGRDHLRGNVTATAPATPPTEPLPRLDLSPDPSALQLLDPASRFASRSRQDQDQATGSAPADHDQTTGSADVRVLGMTLREDRRRERWCSHATCRLDVLHTPGAGAAPGPICSESRFAATACGVSSWRRVPNGRPNDGVAHVVRPESV